MGAVPDPSSSPLSHLSGELYRILCRTLIQTCTLGQKIICAGAGLKSIFGFI